MNAHKVRKYKSYIKCFFCFFLDFSIGFFFFQRKRVKSVYCFQIKYLKLLKNTLKFVDVLCWIIVLKPFIKSSV